jgi:hypothetical protein
MGAGQKSQSREVRENKQNLLLLWGTHLCTALATEWTVTAGVGVHMCVHAYVICMFMCVHVCASYLLSKSPVHLQPIITLIPPILGPFLSLPRLATRGSHCSHLLT